MTRRTLRAALALGTLGTIALGAPAPARAQDARLAAIGDADARSAIGALIVDAERRGLPREPLVTKALEGVEKGAPGPRIEAAVRAMALRLATARVALAPAATPAELLAAADALAAGVPPDAIQSLRAAAPDRSAAVALGVLAQLSARGVPVTRATGVVATLVKRGASHTQLVALQRGVQEDLAVGVAPTEALDLRAKAVIATLPPPPPAAAGAITNTAKPTGGGKRP